MPPSLSGLIYITDWAVVKEAPKALLWPPGKNKEANLISLSPLVSREKIFCTTTAGPRMPTATALKREPGQRLRKVKVGNR
jgi:hypothetical protein